MNNTDSRHQSQEPSFDEYDFEPRPRKVNSISGQYSAFPIEMLESPAWRVLSRAARMFIDRVAIELGRHAGNDNGALPVTYENCIDYGIHDKAVLPAQREAEALGFVECTERGRGGNANYRKPSLWRCTFLNSNLPKTHEWREFKTVADAKTIARHARAPRAVFQGPRAESAGTVDESQQPTGGKRRDRNPDHGRKPPVLSKHVSGCRTSIPRRSAG